MDVFDSNLKFDEKLAYLYLVFCAGNNKQPTMNEIAKHCSISPASAKRAVSVLVEKGWVSKENLYPIIESLVDSQIL
jgi:DNA-binding MarR family transcriptional regulator